MKKYLIKYLYINNFDDDYYSIPIPTEVVCIDFKSVTVYHNWNGKEQHIYTAYNGNKYDEENNNVFDTEEEALKALREERSHFLTAYPNDWKEIIKQLQQLMEEYDGA
jgi:predicted heme/steroid binding protein